MATPQLGAADLEFMAMQAETLRVDAWKCYAGSCPKGFDQGWWMDDEKIAYPMLAQASLIQNKWSGGARCMRAVRHRPALPR